MKKIRLIELFAGVGSQACALKRLGVDFEHYRVIEFDKYPISSYNAIHGTDFKPTSITDIKGEDLGIVDTEYFTYLLTYSFPCFTGDTMVLTKDGFKKLQDVHVDDEVLTHTNTYKKVLAVKQTGIKKTYSVKGMGIDEIRCTDNHKFYVRKMSRHYPTIDGKRIRIRKFSEPQWVECKDLTKQHYLGIAINQNSIIPTWDGIEFTWSDGRKPRHKNNLNSYMNNADFWWLIGRYVGDGWHRSQGGIIICCDKSELYEITDVADRLGFNYSIVEESTVMKIHFADKELENFVEPFGRGAENKRIIGYMFDMPIELLKGFLDGYVSADGCYKDGLYRTTSVSRALTYGIAQLVAKVYKTPYRIYKNDVSDTKIIEGREVHQKPFYTVAWKLEKKKQDKAFFEGGYIWFPIQTITENSNEPVYDIETDIDHSFTANGVIVHNCQDLSVAGKQRGMTKGSGTRSGLLWEVERLLTETEELPQVLLMENVPQVHGKKNLDDFNKWIDFLKSKGYKNFWKDLNAKDYGVAQNRNRTFMISFLDDVNYNFPEPIPLTKRMKDYLEDVVDERYYINNQKAEELINKLIINGELKSNKEPCDLTINDPSTIETANCIKARYDAGISNFKQDGSGVVETVVSDNGLMGTLSAGTHGYGNNHILSQYRIRKLTPKECWRLMGFTDEEFEKAAAVNSNTQLYKQAGNSIVVDVLVAIFSEMINSLEDKAPKYQHMEQMSLFDYE